MKKLAVVLAVVLSVGLLGISALDAAPRLDDTQSMVALDGNGAAWLVENRPGGYLLYSVGTKGQISTARWESAPRDGRVAVTAMTADASSLYYIKNITDSGGRVRRELVRYDFAENTYHTLYTAGASSLLPIASMSLQNELLYLVGILEGTAQVYSIDPLQEGGEPKPVSTYQGEALHGAVWHKDTLYITLASGDIVGYREGRLLPGQQEGLCVTASAASQETLWYYDDASRQVYAMQGLTAEPIFQMPRGETPVAGAARSAKEMVLLIAGEEGQTTLRRWQDGELSPSTRPGVSFAAYAAVFSAHVGSPLFWLSLAGVLLVAGVLVVALAKTVAFKLISITFCGAVLAACLLTGVVYRQSTAGYERERMAQAGMVAAWQGADPMERLELYQGEKSVYAFADLWAVSGGNVRLAQGIGGPAGATAPAVYRGEAVRQTVSAGMSASPRRCMTLVQGVPAAVYVMPVALEEGEGLLAVFLEAGDLTRLKQDLFYGLMGISALIAGAVVIAGSLLVMLRLRPLRGVTAKMQAVADGDYSADDVAGKDDEIGMMQRSMQEVCLSLAIREYETASMVSSYQRFVPQGIDDLLERASISEVSCGDIAHVSGNVGVVTVGNREVILQSLDNQEYMQFVNHCFGAIQGHALEYGAQFLHSDFDMASVPLYFAGNAADGVSFGMQLMGERDSKRLPERQRPRFYMLLHHTDFLYGVAGTENQAFPFLSSSELTFLNSFSDRLEGLGCKIVVTEQYQKNLPETSQLRYIGFVASEDSRYTYKLFEVLDTLPDTERTRRQQYDQKFQEGINLFYKNNFYLARNIFSSILKMCPQDGVARWYTFACEYLFNSDDPQEIRYDLFGVGD